MESPLPSLSGTTEQRNIITIIISISLYFIRFKTLAVIVVFPSIATPRYPKRRDRMDWGRKKAKKERREKRIERHHTKFVLQPRPNEGRKEVFKLHYFHLCIAVDGVVRYYELLCDLRNLFFHYNSFWICYCNVSDSDFSNGPWENKVDGIVSYALFSIFSTLWAIEKSFKIMPYQRPMAKTFSFRNDYLAPLLNAPINFI